MTAELAMADNWTEWFQVIIPGRPQRWQRPFQVGRRRKHQPEVEAAKAAIQWRVRAGLGSAQALPHGQPCRVRLTARFPRPQRGKYLDRNDPGPQLMPVVPDIDNIAKLYLDACSGLVWHDEAQVVGVETLKVYAAVGVDPGVVFAVDTWTP